MKEIYKSLLRKFSGIFAVRSKMTEDEARSILEKYAPRPEGICHRKNKTDIKYHLQVIIPAYNAEKYIAECIKSVLEQETDYQILVTVVNDGSTDSTQTILDKLKEEKQSPIDIEFIQQENKGHSAARNAAISVLKGEYITFLDADDRLPPGALQKMLRTAYTGAADILQGSWYTFYEEDQEDYILSEEGVLEDNRNTFSGYPWGKLYKSTVMQNFQFPEGFWYEDTPISFILAVMPYSYMGIKDIIYGYRRNPEGVTAKSMDSPKSVDTYWITEECLLEFPEFGLKYDQRAYEYVLRQSIMNAWRVNKQPKKIQEAVFVLTSGLLVRYFKGFRTEKKNMKELESILLQKKFSGFKICLRGM